LKLSKFTRQLKLLRKIPDTLADFYPKPKPIRGAGARHTSIDFGPTGDDPTACHPPHLIRARMSTSHGTRRLLTQARQRPPILRASQPILNFTGSSPTVKNEEYLDLPTP